MVDVGVSFRGFTGSRSDEDRGVAAVDHAVVEKETECSCGCGGSSDLFVGDDLDEGLVEVRACFAVVIRREIGLKEVWKRQENKHTT